MNSPKYLSHSRFEQLITAAWEMVLDRAKLESEAEHLALGLLAKAETLRAEQREAGAARGPQEMEQITHDNATRNAEAQACENLYRELISEIERIRNNYNREARDFILMQKMYFEMNGARLKANAERQTQWRKRRIAKGLLEGLDVRARRRSEASTPCEAPPLARGQEFILEEIPQDERERLDAQIAAPQSEASIDFGEE